MSLPVTFLSDFGLEDEFVGVVHGVVATIAPESRVIDLAHSIAPGDIRAGALALMRSVQYVPHGVVLAVVDPGVGTERRAIAAETERGFFVGPDNGLLSPAVALVGGATRIVSIENPEARIPSSGATFHGRDVFAPAAALLASGESTIGELGPDLGGDQVTPLLLPLPDVDRGTLTGEAWWIDRFGNVQTNLSPEDMAGVGLAPGATVSVKAARRLIQVPWVEAYGDVGERELLLHVDSSGLIALAMRSGRADEEMGLTEGMAVSVVGSDTTAEDGSQG